MTASEFPLEAERITYPEIDLSKIGSIKDAEDEHPKASIIDDYLYVAVGNTVKENKSNVIWALQNSGGKKICILHVYTIPSRGTHDVTAYSEKERKRKHKTLDEYIQLCAKAGMHAQKPLIEADSIENGIVTHISQNMITRLVIGAAADRKHKKNMTTFKSNKAIYVQSHAPSFCKIWFLCKGYLISTREEVEPYPKHESEDLTSRMSNGGFSERFPKISYFDSARPSTSSVVTPSSSSRIQGNQISSSDRRICLHGLQAIHATARTNEHYGRRFFRCPLYRKTDKCNYLEWGDERFTTRSTDVIQELVKDNMELTKSSRVYPLKMEKLCLELLCKNALIIQLQLEKKKERLICDDTIRKLGARDHNHTMMTLVLIFLLIVVMVKFVV